MARPCRGAAQPLGGPAAAPGACQLPAGSRLHAQPRYSFFPPFFSCGSRRRRALALPLAPPAAGVAATGGPVRVSRVGRHASRVGLHVSCAAPQRPGNPEPPLSWKLERLNPSRLAPCFSGRPTRAPTCIAAIWGHVYEKPIQAVPARRVCSSQNYLVSFPSSERPEPEPSDPTLSPRSYGRPVPCNNVRTCPASWHRPPGLLVSIHRVLSWT